MGVVTTNKMMDLCLEIEALIALIDRRDNVVPQQVYELLSNKVAVLRTEINALSDSAVEPNYMHTCEVVSVSDDAEVAEESVESVGLLENESTIELPVDETSVAESAIAEELADAYGSPIVAEAEKVRNDVLHQPELSLNDKFRFRRQLFGNSDVDMTEALQVASEMSSTNEVEDYFYNDLCWDASDKDVMDFIEIVTARFR